ncbi:MAG: hypothetical protein EOM12_03890 [Verrucomicrobiae bacterium]|nr:hypothetical protein [Verrucomicrobiae bacterium]
MKSKISSGILHYVLLLILIFPIDLVSLDDCSILNKFRLMGANLAINAYCQSDTDSTLRNTRQAEFEEVKKKWNELEMGMGKTSVFIKLGKADTKRAFSDSGEEYLELCYVYENVPYYVHAAIHGYRFDSYQTLEGKIVFKKKTFGYKLISAVLESNYQRSSLLMH